MDVDVMSWCRARFDTKPYASTSHVTNTKLSPRGVHHVPLSLNIYLDPK